MDSRRAETCVPIQGSPPGTHSAAHARLEALSAYLQHQRTLLARTQADIEKLKKLRERTLASPEHLANCSNLQENYASAPQPLRIEGETSKLQDYHPAQSFPACIDWEAFSSSDATPLRTLAIRTRIDYTQRTVPSNVQRSPFSFLQKFVKDARKVILDPVFESLSASTDMVTLTNSTAASNVNPSLLNNHSHVPTLSLPSPPPEDENEERRQEPHVQASMSPIRKSERTRAKIRELKKHRIRTDLVVGCKLGEEGSNGIFVRHDTEDESAEVDVSMETPRSCLSTPLDSLPDQTSNLMDVDSAEAVTLQGVAQCAKLPNLPRTGQPVITRRDNVDRPSRTRKPSLKLQSQALTALTENEPSHTPLPLMSSQGLGKRCRDVADIDEPARRPKAGPLCMSEVNGDADANRSDTYKQAWSISEQHLLEKLLEEIPDGERNRWAKISQAMGGRRTPRQVASRVQKYVEKLKRFGLGVDVKGMAKS